ncbi:MAG: hypothetical protein K6T37_01735 [Acidothermus cellulolyticus]|nr:hypothetical protein [Acidothermus cellulolyticus]
MNEGLPSPGAPSPSGPRRAAAYLRRLLTEPGPYRRRWQQHALRLRGTRINQAAVAHVLARRLWEAGERDEEHADLPRELKDRVARALRGEVLSPATLRLFIEAFDFTDTEAARLWQLLSGPDADTPREAARGRLARTLLWNETLWLGPDGAPREHRMIHVLQSLVDGLDSETWVVDAAARQVEVVHGGRLVELASTAAQECRATIEFDHPLGIGETLLLECVARFASGLDRPVEFRRRVDERVENLEMRVHFHPDRLPRHVWWVVTGAGMSSHPETVLLDADHAVYRRLARLEYATAGFRWQW